jgi:hypothetical protein
MADPRHVAILQDGKEAWNLWRKREPCAPDLSGHEFDVGADLQNIDFSSTNLSSARLIEAELGYANFWKANLSQSVLTHATAWYADFISANLSGAKFEGATLFSANFSEADLTGADLREADLTKAIFVRTKMAGSNLMGCRIYGSSVWDADLENAVQTGLILSAPDQARITTDSLEVAQFISLLLNNKKIRHVIDTITSKVVLILGRFTPERKAILDAIRDELRKRDYLPVLFDFEKPSNRDITETVSTLAHMARFVIADLSDPKSIPHELAHVAPLLPSVPIMPLIVRPQKEFAMFEHFFGFRHVLKPLRYRDEKHLLSVLNDKVIAPAEKLAQRVAGKRSRR